MSLKRTVLLLLASCSLPVDGETKSPLSKAEPSFRVTNDSLQSKVFLPVAMNKSVTSEDYPAIENERYDQLPVCPASPVCRNEHGVLPAGLSEDCPSACTRTRVTGHQQQDGRYTSSIDAVCPANYVQVATWNMQDELAYLDNPPPVSPVPIGKWTWYLQNGYLCRPGNSLVYETLCASALAHPIEQRDVNALGANLEVNPDNPANIQGMAGTWLNDSRKHLAPSRSEECYAFSCHGKHWSCGDRSYGVILKRKFHFPYQLYQCQPPAGVYATGTKAPVSIVCAYRKVEWRTVPSTGHKVS